MSRLLIVSNRLPVSFIRTGSTFEFKPSVGGLATGVSSLMDSDYEVIWFGWPGIEKEKLKANEKADVTSQLNEMGYYPIFLSQKEIDTYYSGFSNNTIWPLFHYFVQHVVYDKENWKSYVAVNKKFAAAVTAVMKPDDVLWIHDYHHLVLPQMIRDKVEDATIGFFLHIPFPSFEIFRLLPWRREILEGLLGADLIGFHTYDYERHFLSSLRNRLGLEHSLGSLLVNNRMVKVDTFPMGIDYDRYAESSTTPEVKKQNDKYLKQLGSRSERKIILSVDRLDYSKGILERLYSFDRFLEKYPQYKGKVILILVAVPSRTEVDHYIQLKKDLDELVGRINGNHGDIGWIPVWYFYDFLEFCELTSLYNLADVALVTPVRDGMNLIAKEYIATKRDGKGVLILSEMAGAAKELSEAIIVNPNNIERVADSIHLALTMPMKEQISLNRRMQARLKRYDVKKWANEFIEALNSIKEHEKKFMNSKLNDTVTKEIISSYRKSRKRIFLLDYDGTLRAFVAKPQDAKPQKEILTILKKLSFDPKNEVLIISGRDKTTLGKWFEDLDINLIAEHGVWIKEKQGIWELIEPLANYWKNEIRPILERYMDRTPGSHIEEKDYSLVWHFRSSDSELAAIRSRELKEDILHFTTNLGISVLEGNKVIEIKNAGINKGHAALKWIGNEYYDFIFAIGDDRTDEDMFQVCPPHAFTIKVGLEPSEAKYSIDSVKSVHSLLKKFTEADK